MPKVLRACLRPKGLPKAGPLRNDHFCITAARFFNSENIGALFIY